MLLQGCYLGNNTSARRFRLASWDVWDPSRYGSELKFVKIVTNTCARVPLEQGTCYETRLVKHVDSHEEYVCLDTDSAYPQQYPCGNFHEHEVMPTFLLHPNTPEIPDDFTDNFVGIQARPEASGGPRHQGRRHGHDCRWFAICYYVGTKFDADSVNIYQETTAYDYPA